MKQLITTLLIFLFLQPSWASLYRSYQVEDGLSHNSVWAVMQDKQGFLWFGTVDGLNRFDGNSFKIYKKQQGDSLSIGNNFIHCLKEDSHGHFLVGTKQGLYLFNRENETFSHVKLNNRSREGDDTSINYIMEDPDGNIWLGCYGQGIYVLGPDLQVRKHYMNKGNPGDISSNHIWCMVQDYNGVIWIGSDGGGLIRLDPKDERFTSIMHEGGFNLTDPTIYSLYCDMDNTIWVGTSVSGLYRCNFRTGKISNIVFPNRKILSIKAITAYSNNELVMGSDAGLIKVDCIQETISFINEGPAFDNITDKSIFSIAHDMEGGLWIGTYFGGVNYYSPYANKFAYYPGSGEDTSKSIISYFAEESSDRIWVGTKNEGLSLFNPTKISFEPIQMQINYHDIQALMMDNDKLWISVYGKGVSVVDVHTNALLKRYSNNTENSDLLISNIVNVIFKTSKGQIFFGTPEGVNCLDAETKKISLLERTKGIPVKAIMEDYNGSIWFAAHMHGLLHLSADGTWESFTHIPEDSTSLMGNNVNCIHQDARYRIWVGTEGEGMGLFNPKTKKFEYILTEKMGLPSNIIYAIQEDADGNIWVSTGGGLAQIDPETRSICTFRYIEDLIKLRYNLNCALRGRDNHLYFGGTNGFIAFSPKDIQNNEYKPPICLTGFQISGNEVTPGAAGSPLKESISMTQKIELEYNQAAFSFDFVCLSYLSPAQNKYAYKLEGFDTDWHYVTNGNNKAIYMNIPSGKYTFYVKGTNNNGVWCDNPVKVVVIVKRPFWLSNIMLLFYAILAVSAFTLLIRRYNRRLESINQDKMYKYKVEKEKEIYETKINFFTDMAHEIRTPLSLIVAPLENIILSGDGSQQTKSNLEIIKRNANRLLELVNQLLDFRKIEEDMFRLCFSKQNISEIVRNIHKRYVQYARLKNIELKLKEPEKDIVCVVDKEAMEKIIGNLLSNAVKYANSLITISMSTDNNLLTISVEDDGPGIKSEFLDKIFESFFQIENNAQRTGSGLGLALSKSLVAKHKGNITAVSDYGHGCTLTFNIPMDIQVSISQLTEDKPEQEETCVPQTVIIGVEGKLKIVLAEDNQELRSFLSSYLSDYLDVYEAQNGLEALQLIENENVDIIISDILMPEMDGLELCKAVKSDPAYSHLPFILLSARTDTATKIEGLNIGADVYMEKPFSSEQLRAQINSIINNRNSIRENFIKSPLDYYKQKSDGPNGNTEFIEKLNVTILENLTNEDFSIDNLSEMFLMSRSNLHKKIKNIVGMTPNDYIKLIRLNQSAQLLATGKYKINEVCYLVGFNTPSYFSKCFYEHFGKLPKDFIVID